MTKNPYEVLGVNEGASMDEIKRAYRRKAKEYHPDLHPDDPKANEKMQQINEAYDMLCNPDKYRSAQRQADTGTDPYAAYRQRAYDDYARRNWQYTYYTGDSRNAWQAWQQPDDAQPRQTVRIINPFRTVLRFLGGIMLFRFIMSILRLLIFGF